jgi:hypothetical protein
MNPRLDTLQKIRVQAPLHNYCEFGLNKSAKKTERPAALGVHSFFSNYQKCKKNSSEPTFHTGD